jgi:hypothetical protein
MRALILGAAILSATASVCWSERPPEELVKNLTAVIRERCPDATIEVTNDLFTAKYGTMMFTLHGHQKTGEISPKTYQEEGPSFKGFVLPVGVEKGRYDGQAKVPQELHGPCRGDDLDVFIRGRDGSIEPISSEELLRQKVQAEAATAMFSAIIEGAGTNSQNRTADDMMDEIKQKPKELEQPQKDKK